MLLDFGLAPTWSVGAAPEPERGSRRHGRLHGSRSRRRAAVSPASDWYSVGVMLYEALTGRLPFDGPALEVLDAQAARSSRRPRRSWSPGVPEDLDALCVELLRATRRAADGPATCSAACGGAAGSAAPESAPRAGPAAAPLIGRERHLERSSAAFAARPRAGRSPLLRPRPLRASGKSALVRALPRRLTERDDAVVLAGRCYEQESVPYKALDSVVDALSRYLDAPRRARRCRRVLPRDVRALARVFPVLQRVRGGGRRPRDAAEVPDPQELRRRAFAALRELLARLGDRRPLVLAIDDLQWGDADSAALLVGPAAARPTRRAAAAGLLPQRGRGDEPVASRAFAARREGDEAWTRRELAVEPLTAPRRGSLALALLGRDDPAASRSARPIARESGGNPFFVDELVQHIQAADAGRSVRSPAGEIDARRGALGPDRAPAREARRLLEVVAVSGRPLSQAEAAGPPSWATEAGGAGRPAVRPADPRHRAGASATRSRPTTTGSARRSSAASRRRAARGHHRRLAGVLEAVGPGRPRGPGRPLPGRRTARAGGRLLRPGGGRRRPRPWPSTTPPSSTAWPWSSGRPARRRGAPLRTRLGDALANAGRGAAAARNTWRPPRGDARRALELPRRAAMQLLISGHVDDGLTSSATCSPPWG